MITIQTNADFTPAGRRSVRVAPYGRSIIRWYVGGRKYRTLPLTHDNLALTDRWLSREA